MALITSAPGASQYGSTLSVLLDYWCLGHKDWRCLSLLLDHSLELFLGADLAQEWVLRFHA